MKKLFEEVRLGRLRLKNRLVRSATWEALADGEGRLTRPLLDGCAAVARGGAGCFVAGFTSVSDLDPGFGGMARLSGAAHVPGFRRLAEICHAEGCVALVQLALSECVLERAGVAGRGMEPGDLGEADLQAVAELFAAAAGRACAAGLDGVQIHAAHGFLSFAFFYTINPPQPEACEADLACLGWSSSRRIPASIHLGLKFQKLHR